MSVKRTASDLRPAIRFHDVANQLSETMATVVRDGFYEYESGSEKGHFGTGV